jgi:CMP-N-acetylneuraminic acid synthetase
MISADMETSTAGKEVIAIIPAREGSKGLPGKNLADLGGLPLIAYSILAARSCSLITRIVVSTDSMEIAKEAERWGGEIPFLRPASLSSDRALPSDAVKFTLQELTRIERYKPSCVTVLFPTHPFRTQEMMDLLLDKLVNGARQVITVKRVTAGPCTHFVLREGRMSALHPENYRYYYRRYGVFAGHWYGCENDCGQIYAHQLCSEAELIDIDTKADLLRANQLLKQGAIELGYI